MDGPIFIGGKPEGSNKPKLVRTPIPPGFGTELGVAATPPKVVIDPKNGVHNGIDVDFTQLSKENIAAAMAAVGDLPGDISERGAAAMELISKQQAESYAKATAVTFDHDPTNPQYTATPARPSQLPPTGAANPFQAFRRVPENPAGAVALQVEPPSLAAPTVDVSIEIAGKIQLDAVYHQVIAGPKMLVLAWDTRWPGKPTSFANVDSTVAVYVPNHRRAYNCFVPDLTFVHANMLFTILLVKDVADVAAA